MASTCLDARHFNSFLYATGAFQAACYPGAEAQREWLWVGESMCGFFKRSCLGLQKFFPPTQSPLVFVARSCAVLSSGTGTLWLGVGLGLLVPKISLPNFVWTYRYRTSLFCISVPPTILDRCGFFNSIVVRLQLNFWWFWMMIVLYFSCNFDVVVWEGELCFPMPPSWPEV